MFNKPKSFAVDLKGNLYVADKNNHAIRKISKSGVTTVAGGYSPKPGHSDGPARNASFSDDFELNFIPGSYALIISDRGNKLIRQINLKAEDCSKDSPSVLGLTSAWILTLTLGVACLFGLLAGFFIRPYVASYEGSSRLHYNETWKHILINLGKRAVILCFNVKVTKYGDQVLETIEATINEHYKTTKISGNSNEITDSGKRRRNGSNNSNGNLNNDNVIDSTARSKKRVLSRPNEPVNIIDYEDLADSDFTECVELIESVVDIENDGSRSNQNSGGRVLPSWSTIAGITTS